MRLGKFPVSQALAWVVWRAPAVIVAALLGAITIVGAGCQGPLPEQDSYPAQLYMKRCDGCHQAYHPHKMTPAMWQLQVDMMEPKMREAGIAPLTPEERQIILDYLQRNAGRQ